MRVKFSIALLALSFHGLYVSARLPYFVKGNSDKCIDEGVWMAEGSVDCKYLRKNSHWGLHMEAEQRCKTDANTKCCRTCKRLGFKNGSPDSQNPTPIPPTTAPPTPAQSTKAPPTNAPPGPTDPNCKDNHIWLMDMSVDCKYLEKKSHFGIASDPEYYCTKYALTDCCQTCARLGFPKDSNQSQTTKTTTTTTTAATTTTTRKATTAKPGWPTCRDIGVVTKYGFISCKYLEKKSFYRIHENSLQYCRNPWTTWCCETCARIQGRKPYGYYFNFFGFKTPTIKQPKMSNKVI